MKRIVTAVVGGLIVVAGAVLIVLPGPGMLVMVAGFAVLAREFEWAARPLRWARSKAAIAVDLIACRPLFAVLDALFALGLIAVAVLDLTVGLPLIEPVGDAFVILSGVVLLATLGYARRRGPQVEAALRAAPDPDRAG